MTSTVTAPDICRLAEADAATLRQIWQETKGTAPPKTFTARLMRLALAWDAQAALSGGEPAGTRRAWSRVIRARIDSRSPKSRGGAVPATVGDGTRILKDWGGKMHEVVITADCGATWNGQSYSSLSAVARAMTGTNRNGPKFFGLREVAMQ
ncbi:DUF2924 domain-containing protein [Alisedimentitalea sp. MJ-SS2]|uniref:DUF2924 domain-containing protein n=1 Tax=Aliisedimentitalea sp. MJ-SS2 TaxID=3049795 RepID=UPI00290E81FE|nr:DUF2924 domain-containing protein [Alisedimentitalea sp. MJ-SS2]MDU8926284.1 DUF2924 domain-containing protein [Alisedimentitalea sp. MJ-SS2]